MDRSRSSAGGGVKTVVVSFRAPVSLAKKLDELARDDQRNRGNFILRTLTHSVYAMELLAEQGQTLLTNFHKCYKQNPTEGNTEFWRGKIAGWKQALATAYGAGPAERIILRASEAVKLPVPHSMPLTPDGKGYEDSPTFRQW